MIIGIRGKYVPFAVVVELGALCWLGRHSWRWSSRGNCNCLIVVMRVKREVDCGNERPFAPLLLASMFVTVAVFLSFLSPVASHSLRLPLTFPSPLVYSWLFSWFTGRNILSHGVGVGLQRCKYDIHSVLNMLPNHNVKIFFLRVNWIP